MLRQIQGVALPPSRWETLCANAGPAFTRYLEREVYARGGRKYLDDQIRRYRETLAAHRRRFGDAPCILMRAPGRLNAFLEYLDMCAGDHMSTTIDGDIPAVACVRPDDTVEVQNTSPLFPVRSFVITEELSRFAGAPWGQGKSGGLPDNWDNRTRVHPYFGGRKGDHVNYCLAAFLRMAWSAPGAKLRGVNMTIGPSTVPLRAGTSSSSAIVVLAALACLWANPERAEGMSEPALCRLLGEAEWYVGTHGGANDHATILRNAPNAILYNRHSRAELDATPLPFLQGLHIIVANSLWEANKALGANYVFNLRKGWMDLGNDLLARVIAHLAVHDGPCPAGWARRAAGVCLQRDVDAADAELLDTLAWTDIQKRYRLFGSLDASLLGIPQEAIAQLIGLVPDDVSPAQARALLGKDDTQLARDYTLPDGNDRVWRPRNAARFFNRENIIGRRIEALLLEADGAGEPPDSAAYDTYRVRLGELIEDVQDTIRNDFMVSNAQLDLLLDIARRGPGYLAGKLIGAGSGGCVCLFVRANDSEAMLRHLDREYYGVDAHFDTYRDVLAHVDDADLREQMRRSLGQALADIPAQRRVVSFSRGAGILDAGV